MRNLGTALAAAISSGELNLAILAMLTFRTSTQYVWTGTYPLVALGQTFTGVGSLAGVGAVNEGVEVKADGTSVSLSGIDPIILAECLSDIQLGAPAKLWVAAFTEQGVMIGVPYPYFVGTVDKPLINVQGQSIGITLALENKLVDHQRANNLRYTSADQALLYSDDSGFDYVEKCNDIALVWGS